MKRMESCSPFIQDLVQDEELFSSLSSEKSVWMKLAKRSHFKAGELAVKCGIHIRTLQRYFDRKYHLTISEYLRQLRLEQAGLRIYSGQPVKVVAYDLAYKQLSHFSRDFKSFFGIPPRAFQHREKPIGKEENDKKLGKNELRYNKIGKVPRSVSS